MSKEKWRPVPGYEELYQVSSHGRVWRNAGTPQCWSGRYLSPGVQRHGHLFVGLYKGGTPSYRNVHRLVALAFLGAPFKGAYAAHKNGVPSDNRVENIYWATPTDNSADKIRHGTNNNGERHGLSKLTSGDVVAIRNLCEVGYKQKEVAALYGISRQNVGLIVNNKAWKHLEHEGAEA